MEHLVGRTRGTQASSVNVLAIAGRSRGIIDAHGDDAPLTCLGTSSLNVRYHAWRGASGTRYTTSVFPVDHAATEAGLPAFDGFVLIPVVRRGGTLRPLDVVAVETDAGRCRALTSSLARGVDEWHVHLLADDARRRRTVVEDLLDRHCPAMGLSA